MSAARKATELKIRCWCFQKTQIFKAHLIHAPNNEVVVNDNIELAGEPIKLIGHINIGFGGRGVTAGVVMHQNEGRCAQFKRAFDNLTRLNWCVIHRAGAHHFIGDNVVFLVEEQHMKFFLVLLGNFRAAIANHLVPVCQRRFVHDAALPEV